MNDDVNEPRQCQKIYRTNRPKMAIDPLQSREWSGRIVRARVNGPAAAQVNIR